MSLAWEINDDDIFTVLSAHKAEVTVEVARKALDEKLIIKGLLNLDDFEAQVASMMEDIEKQLMEKKIISGDLIWGK